MILVVEDNDSCYYLIAEILESVGASVLRASNGEDGVQLCMQDPGIDLVIMDILLPGMDGIQASKLIKEQRQDLGIIGVSAASSEHMKNVCIEAGCKKFIAKPIDIGVFLMAVQDLLES